MGKEAFQANRQKYYTEKRVIHFLFLVIIKSRDLLVCEAPWYKGALLMTEVRVCLFSDEELLKFWSRSSTSSSTEVTVTVLRERHSWVLLPLALFKPSLARRKISSPPQHASLSFVKFQDYTIIHPTQEAEEDTWAGEVTSHNKLHRHWLSFDAFSGTEKFPHSERCSCLGVHAGSGL